MGSATDDRRPAVTQTAAQILRAEFERERLDQIGGEPLQTSGFEHEQYELDFGPDGGGEDHA